MADIFNDGKGTIGSHQGAGSISPLQAYTPYTPINVPYKSSLQKPQAGRPESATSKYSAVVFSQPVIAPEVDKDEDKESDADDDDYEDDFEDDFEPYETSNEEEVQAEQNNAAATSAAQN